MTPAISAGVFSVMGSGHTRMPEITGKSWLMVLTLGLVWGGTFMVTEVALQGITPFWLAAARTCLAAALMAAVWGARGFALFGGPVRRCDMARLLLIGALSSAAPFMLLSWGQQFVSSGFAGVSMAASPMMVLPMAHFLLPGERMTLRRFIGFLIGFAGVTVLIGGQAFTSTGAGMESVGRIACVCASACYAISSVQMRLLPKVDPIGLNAAMLCVGAIPAVAVAWWVEGPLPAVDTQTLAILALLGLVPTAAASLLRVMVVRTAGPVFMSLTSYQVPVWSVILGTLILSEPLPPSLLLALALILCGLALSQAGALRRLFLRR